MKAVDLASVLNDERYRKIGPFVKDMMARFEPIRTFVERQSTLFRRKIQDCGCEEGSIENTLHEMAVVFSFVLDNAFDVEYEPERSGPDLRVTLKADPQSATWLEITRVGDGRPVLELKDFVAWINANLADLNAKCVSHLDFSTTVLAGIEPLTPAELKEIFRRKRETLEVIRKQIGQALEEKGKVFTTAVPGSNLSKYDLGDDDEDVDPSVRVGVKTYFLGTMADSTPYLDRGGCRPELPRLNSIEKIRDVCLNKGQRQFTKGQRGVLIMRTMSEDLDCPSIFEGALRELDAGARLNPATGTWEFELEDYPPCAILFQHSWPSQSRPGNFLALNNSSVSTLPDAIRDCIRMLPLWPGK